MALLIRIAFMAIVGYVIVRWIRASMRPATVGVPSNGSFPMSDPSYSDEVFLTGRLLVRVIHHRTGQPLARKKVVFEACGFT
ncbi:MAG: hypothetical protein KDC38_14025 [Planctomycetes bacterium]|nr:hypothetical protein [Planctomycetota bacterium]